MLILNPNFTIDRTISLDVLVPGAVHRTGSVTTSLGGKGVNVARVARAFGRRGRVVGFLPDASSPRMRQLAVAEGAELDGVPVGGSVRCASVMLEASGRVTVFNEPGPVVDVADWDRLLARIAEGTSGHETLVCSGSLPPGSPSDAYARAVAVARGAGLRSIVDATGAALLAALEERPDVVSPNLAEAESLLHGVTIEAVEPSGDDVIERAEHAARALVEAGARRAIVSAGSHGAACSSDAGTSFHPAPRVAVVSPVGAGDSLVGGLAHALENRQPWTRAMEFALAVASASCEQPVAGQVDVSRVWTLVAGTVPSAAAQAASRETAQP